MMISCGKLETTIIIVTTNTMLIVTANTMLIVTTNTTIIAATNTTIIDTIIKLYLIGGIESVYGELRRANYDLIGKMSMISLSLTYV